MVSCTCFGFSITHYTFHITQSLRGEWRNWQTRPAMGEWWNWQIRPAPMGRRTVWADGGTGRRDGLRSRWGNPWRFDSSSAHLAVTQVGRIPKGLPRSWRGLAHLFSYRPWRDGETLGGSTSLSPIVGIVREFPFTGVSFKEKDGCGKGKPRFLFPPRGVLFL